jgi:hypothetical protein
MARENGKGTARVTKPETSRLYSSEKRRKAASSVEKSAHICDKKWQP